MAHAQKMTIVKQMPSGKFTLNVNGRVAALTSDEVKALIEKVGIESFVDNALLAQFKPPVEQSA